MANNRQIATDVLEAVGGKQNVSSVTHCMTRLRFVLKDESIPDAPRVGKIPGVIGTQVSGGQFQVIIGQNVGKVYEEVCQLGGFAMQAAIDENLDDVPKQKLTIKTIGSNILDYLSSCMIPMIPVMTGAALFKMVQVILGPSMLGFITAEDDLYILFDFLYQAFFYFLPIYLGYTAAKKLGVTPVLGMFAGCLLIVPGFVQLAQEEGASFTVYGIPASLHTYSQTVLPAVLSVWVMSYIERFFKRIIPDLFTIFAPFFTIAVMVPIELCALAPIGAVCGEAISGGLLAFGATGGFIAIALVAATWQFLVLTGMHLVVITLANAALLQNGVDNFIFVSAITATWATYGLAVGGMLRLRGENRALSTSYFISAFLGGITEPIMYGIAIRYKRPFIGLVAGGLAGGLYQGLMHVACYAPGMANITNLTRWAGGGTTNLINGTIGCVIALVVAALVTYFIGFTKEDIKESNTSAEVL